MSSDAIARMLAFYKKADELCSHGQVLRAAENYGRAAEAARALGADNLVTLHALLRQGDMFMGYALGSVISVDSNPHIRAAHRADAIAIYTGAVEVLERRRVAGTLLEGKCTAVEESWRARVMMQRSPDFTPAEAASWATLIGYEEFLRAATYISDVLKFAHLYEAECSYAQFQCFTQHVVHATDLMQQPRRHSGSPMHEEAKFAHSFRTAVAVAQGLDASLVQQLEGASQRLHRSGVLETRCLTEVMRSMIFSQQTHTTRVLNSVTAPGLRSCALPGCGAKEAHPAHFKSCAACRAVVYCCREHQVAGWPGHKKACKAARKAAAADEAVGPSGA